MTAKPQILPGGIEDVPGFRAIGVHAGLRKARKDMALIASEPEASAAGVFTTNKVKAAPLLVTRSHLRSGRAKAVVVNSACANACTGEQGLSDAREMTRLVGAHLGVPASRVLVASTGVIGKRLPMEKVRRGVKSLAKNLDKAAPGNASAREAILTTDTKAKSVLVRFAAGGRTCVVGGIAKGSGMIHPNMATMLAFLGTDAAVAPADLKAALKRAVDATFNMITVDGDSSTNDMVLLLANGATASRPLAPGTADFAAFEEALSLACRELAKQIARDGEGATTLVEVSVSGARSPSDARRAAKAIAASNLVKAAVYGRDPNWGRILCAIGYSGARMDPAKVDLVLKNGVGAVKIVERGVGRKIHKTSLLRQILASEHVQIRADLHDGDAQATAWGCDLTYDYVKINAHYTT
ncbi:MAG TPA: bifunctional ornithine acetyltransferase/N-acetylglutamate synthase [Candidatus Thermoplasmatota archaeon]|nr:bifunctional ornithine acetyltransferase/N-acetylglutamate synthase [Candidatus Thermoplasmatota archaeon]